MIMELNLIYGGVGSGKTERCIELICEIIGKNPDERAILTVPDQYSYTAERRLVERLGGTGVNGIEVLTFSQLFSRYLKKVKNYLSPAGRHMLFYTAAAEKGGDSEIFSRAAGKPGFIDKVSELAAEMKRSLIEPQALLDAAGDGEDMFSQKLRAFAGIYEYYNSLILPGFADSDDDFKRLAQAVYGNEDFKNTHIWIDGFSDFLPQHYEVIKAFMHSAKSVNITLCLPDGEKCESDVFFAPLSTAKKLKMICSSLGVTPGEQYCEKVCRSIKSDELLFLAENWGKRRSVYKGKTSDISLYCARDLYSEIEYVAKMIIREVKNGAHFSDIGILCGNSEQYSHLIEAVFSDFKIPYFSDSAQQITEHPIILTLLAAFDIADESWSYESVFRYLRAGYIYIKNEDGIRTIDREDVDILENYVLKHGIRGKKKWLEEWQETGSGVFSTILNPKKKDEDDIERINSIRRTVIKPFEGFYSRGGRCVRDFAESLFEFLCDIHLYEGIACEAEELSQAGMRDESERMKKIWNLLMEVINQAAVALGDKKCSRESFREMMRAGLSKAAMQIIPPGLDSVSVGAADRNSPTVRKILFFVGAVNGTMPPEDNTSGILTDSERIELIDKGLEIGGNPKTKAEREIFKLYRAVTSATEKLYFSYPTSDSEGNAKQPAALIRDLYKMFPDMQVSDGLGERRTDGIFTPRQAFLYIMQSVRDERCRPNVKKLADCFGDEHGFDKKLDMVGYAAAYRKVQPEITAESAKLLYKDYHRYSVSRLNDYSACPFGYFVKHGLRAKEQEIWQIHKFEIGSLLHWAVCEYCREVEDGAESFAELSENWRTLSDEKSCEIVDKIMDDIAERVLRGLSDNRGKIEYLLVRMKKILMRSVDIVRLSLAKGEYAAVCYERQFEVDIEWNGKSIGLNGTIDRVDASEDAEAGKIYLRIIDYKSGSKAFDVVSISNNTDMQLALYAVAATELYKKGALGRADKGLTPAVSGILYNKLRDDMLVFAKRPPEDIAAQLRGKMKLDGLVVTDDDEAADVQRMDKCLAVPGARSEFLRLAVNSKGTGLDKRLSSSVSRERFEILLKYVKKTAVRLDDEIFKGNIEIKPSSGSGGRACRFCAYREVCLYDIRTDGERKGIEKEDAAWAHMESETQV